MIIIIRALSQVRNKKRERRPQKREGPKKEKKRRPKK